jgi:hypothetical protein
MEQYIQMLIPADPHFIPPPRQIAAYFETLADSWHFELDWNIPYIHPLRVFKLPSKAEVEKAVEASAPSRVFPRLERFHLQTYSEIPAAIEGLRRSSVSAIGNWSNEFPPIRIPKSSWPAEEKGLYCSVGCDLRHEPTLTSNWWTADDRTGLLQFGDSAETIPASGTFTHPISHRNIEIPSAGCARFWVSFDFGEWLLSHMPEDFDLLDPGLIRATEDFFDVQMTQAGRALP